MIYRGFKWYEDDRSLSMTGSGIHAVLKYRTIITFRHKALVDLGMDSVQACAEAYWGHALAVVRILIYKFGAMAYQPLDGVPWEIHVIEDEIAYTTALKAFLATTV